MPMNRANCSAKTPNVSASYAGRRTSGGGGSRAGCRGARGAERRLSHGAHRPRRGSAAPDRAVAPVLGQQVVEQVVDGDRAEQAAVLVDDRRRDQVVGREVGARPRRSCAVGAQARPCESSSAPATSVDGGSRSSRWMWATPRSRPVGVSSGGRQT